ncbi:MAG: hypothetical protein D8M58_01035 [Calditrichaeota bacterium]|nr:MAG: hypothetical protein DWQ03_06045 [Calditrichota bacterium]MBL1203952.1 hypothetical protein [Calditrichota bacterium]NOG43783.1 hypothetical protein [Calditrichota bacterium]
MKVFLMIIGAILVIAALSIFWAYSSFTYQPDYFEEVEKINFSEKRQQGREIEARVREELNETGETKVSGDEITSLIISQISKRGKVDLQPIVKKVKSEIIDGRLKMEALVDVEKLTKQEMPDKVREYLDLFLESAPKDMLENVYVSFDGIPIRDGSVLKFAEDAQINIGDFSYDLASIKGSHKIRIGASMLKKLGISNFEVLENQILLKK